MTITHKRALLSVSDKAGLVHFARALSDLGFELVSTGGTASLLAGEGLAVTKVSDVTGFPEIMGGRVKTLHPKVHGGLLADQANGEHMATLQEQEIAPFGLLVVNLYPFAQTLAGGADFATCIENIDIGGPAMVRACAKNHASVLPVVDPGDYERVLALIEAEQLDAPTRRGFAAKAFAHTARYDAQISRWLQQAEGHTSLPDELSFAGAKSLDLRYGENPHQNAALYLTAEQRPGIATGTLLQGKPLSYNNLNDADAAFELVSEFDDPAVAIIKHANPCGVALGDDLYGAYRRALACDQTSAFGSIVACNRPLDGSVAAAITEIFTEVVIAPDADDAARAVFAQKPNLRLVLTGTMPDPLDKGLTVKSIAGGLLVQSRDDEHASVAAFKAVTAQTPDATTLNNLAFAQRVAKHVKSNTIVLVAGGATLGIGAGQMSRVDAAHLAIKKAGEAGLDVTGAVAASDAFFPFADGIQALIDAGISAVVQPGGSMRDDEVIAAADASGMAMVFTGTRHFRH
ncbi:MAG: bifunctional phosphoribosylaminoimidazolecarboxamide formyltransferase/IMP cyclohydrolase PurH [Alphaproteobacteria bacterium TMED89]|nr:bifunctional phosphoribosylaminoimidazolecarboxamide formyltransferase/inosine monophosphate cyclohydrolase [Rhodospirillaceae bacterium]RPH10422.1 MAG: bifunctional phosphoribosylaminoimidazolecarboxamide formyltransferase/IMP cyclohydrolase PurH [Alphaproteobacteria bacterium TMED89]